MATATKTYTFTPSTVALSGQVNQNFDDLLAFMNTQVMHRDASSPFTAIPSGPASNPSSPNQLARKQYVDDHKMLVNTTAFSLPGAAIPNATETVLAQTASITAVANHNYHCFVKIPRVLWQSPGGAFSSFLSIDVKHGAGAFTRAYQRAEPASLAFEYSYDTDFIVAATAATIQFRCQIFQNYGAALSMVDPGSTGPRIYVVDLGGP